MMKTQDVYNLNKGIRQLFGHLFKHISFVINRRFLLLQLVQCSVVKIGKTFMTF